MSDYLNNSGEVSELTFLQNDTGTLRHILALLRVQGIVREENTRHPLALALALALAWRSV
ncbi:hypothetical protein OQJ65_21955 [Vibrio sp. Sgm 22]|uniref:hypothetical protein n=1 Tax=unclassified Vibrio TaxID=2614977 RepID=UPI0022493532|nr:MULTISPECIES: hypothetical protein [unclassified Vibrio]MCX2761064.1 hypothetical protein [Vibrio sp. 14G-20]MCX2777977.1 hypothetical protein [Vibrio sp. Sgm 22]